MIASWMIYAGAVTAVLALAAALLDHAAGSALRQRRWIWVTALGLSLGIPVWSLISAGGDTAAAAADRPDANVVSSARAPLGRAGEVIADLIARAEPVALGRLDAVLGFVWVASAVAALGVYVLGAWSITRRRRSWPEAAIDGERVLVAPTTGPAVVGAFRPAIVVPEWSLRLPDEQRALMLEHERQHVVSRDPLVLHAAALAVVAMPWNIAAWWMMRRLRLAIELDCDARVLAAGRDARAYGNLLLDVCARRLRVGALLSPALFERTSSLTRRILAMHPRRSRFAAARLTLGAAVAVGMTFVACDVPSPEAVAPSGRNEPTGGVYANANGLTGDRTTTTRAIVARYFPAVARGEGGPSILFITKAATGKVVLTEARPAGTPGPRIARPATSRQRGAADSARSTSGQVAASGTVRLSALPVQRRRVGAAGGGPFTGSFLATLRPEDIASVDVSKHEAGAVAPNAVSLVTITLKPGAVLAQATRP